MAGLHGRGPVGSLARQDAPHLRTGANARVTGKLERAGLIAMVGRDNFRENIVEALEKCRTAVAPDGNPG